MPVGEPPGEGRDITLRETIELRRKLGREDDLTEDDHRRIRELLLAAFPRTTRFREVSYLGGRPEYRLWYEDAKGRLVAHLDFERRVIGVGGQDVLVAGIGEVCVAPRLHGQGLGRRLMMELENVLRMEAPARFGILFCLEEYVAFYERLCWRRVDAPLRVLQEGTREPVEGAWPSLIKGMTEPTGRWPDGAIDLRGPGW